MPWSGSAIIREFVTDALANAVAYDLSGAGIDTFKIALFNNTPTPDKDSSVTGYNEATGQWLVANEKTSSTDWPAGGPTLDSVALSNPAAGVIMWDAADEVSGSNATLTDVHGSLIYDDTIAADPGICYLYFGGANSVTAGTLTVQFNASGIFRITV
jgi:hypothetical protein